MRQDRGGASIAVVAVWECNRSYQDTNRCRGYGFVRFASSEDVKKALEKFVVVKFQAENLNDPAIRRVLVHW